MIVVTQSQSDLSDENKLNVKSEVLTNIQMNISIFMDMTAYRLMNMCRKFQGRVLPTYSVDKRQR